MKRLKLKDFLMGAGVVTLLILGAYSPALKSGFIWDDDFWVYRNPVVRGEENLSRIWHTAAVPGQNYPLTYTFFWAQRRLWSLNPVGFHLSNLLLHILNIISLWMILRRLKLKNAFAAALIYGLHPILVESVAWITEAKNLLSAFFIFSSYLFYLKFEDKGEKMAYFAALFLFLLALLSKTFVAPFPLVILVLSWYRSGRIRKVVLKAILPFLALSLLAGAFTWIYEVNHVGVRGEEWAFSGVERVLIAGRAFWFYPAKLILPLKFTFMYPRWEISPRGGWSWFYPITALAVLVFLFRRRRRSRGLFAVIFSYTLLIAPALGLISFYAQRYSLVADHYAYLASIAPLAGGGSWFSHRLSRSAARRLCISLVIACLFFLTHQRVRAYRSLETIWRDTISKNPRCDMAHNNLGVLLVNAGRREEGIGHYREAIKYNPRNAYAYNNLGLALAKKGRYAEAISAYDRSIEIRPRTAGFYSNLGLSLEAVGRTEEAIASYRRAFELKPDLTSGRLNLIALLQGAGKQDEAIAYCRKFIKMSPESAPARYNLGVALEKKGDWEEAAKNYTEAIRLRPDYTQAYLNRGGIYFQEKNYGAAAGDYRRALEIQPDYFKAYYNLGLLLSEEGKTQEAIEYLKKAIRLRPESQTARQALRQLRNKNPAADKK